MDRFEALVAIAHLRLRLVMIERHPHLLTGVSKMEIKRPIELAGLKSRLARAKATEAAIAVTGKRYDTVLDAIDEAHGAAKSHVGHLEGYHAELKSTVEGMIAGSNGGPNDGRDGQVISANDVGDIGQIISSETPK